MNCGIKKNPQWSRASPGDQGRQLSPHMPSIQEKDCNDCNKTTLQLAIKLGCITYEWEAVSDPAYIPLCALGCLMLPGLTMVHNFVLPVSGKIHITMWKDMEAIKRHISTSVLVKHGIWDSTSERSNEKNVFPPFFMGKKKKKKEEKHIRETRGYVIVCCSHNFLFL